jgi:hypothetical protein
MDGAMSRIVRRKPLIYLLVILPVLAGGGMVLLLTLIEAYSQVRDVAYSAIPGLNGMLITLPAFFLWIPISLLISNFVLYFMPPLRRIAEEYATRSGHAGFAASQKGLLKLLGIFTLVCLPLILLGFIL